MRRHAAVVIELDSDDEAEPAKRPRTGSSAPEPSPPPGATTAGGGFAGPLCLNRLLDPPPTGPWAGVELSLQDVFEVHPSLDRRPPREALLANFMVDLRWLLDECPSLVEVPTLTVLHGDDAKGCGGEAVAARKQRGLETRLHSPPLPMQWGTHHSKMALLLYDDCVRVCVKTFNDLYSDAHCKSQALYVQDFPAGESSELDVFGTDFARQLRRYLARCGGFDGSKLDRYDFSSASGALVASVPGYHKGQELEEWGHMRLRRLLLRHAELPAGWPGPGAEEGVVCQFSSLGSLTPKWLEEFHATLASTAPPSGGGPAGTALGRPPLRLVVPTAAQVRDCGEGWLAGLSVPIRRANLKDFLRPHWRLWGAASAADRSHAAERARAAMPHVKSYCRYAARPGRPPALPWLCIGSHNLSRAAWGELQKGGTQLAIRSYELSVAFFPRRLAQLEPDPGRQQGRFLRRRGDGGGGVGGSGGAAGAAAGVPVLVPLASLAAFGGSAALPGVSVEVPVACPTEVPPAGPPADPIWAVDLDDEAVSSGLDRFGTRNGERMVSFYGRRAAHREKP